MSTTLDPRIAAKLDAFAHRRRRLILFRGICAAVAMLLGAMMIVALIDWIFVLSDGVRWGLSIAAYVAVLIVAWRTCGRLLVQVPDSRRLARLIENAEPSLREELLSAVELGQGSAEWDSEQFRALVQADVSNRVEGLQMDRLLPAVLIRTAGVALAVMVVLCLIALVVPSLRFGALLVRALAPGANLDRVSSVQVKIIQPAPAEMAVPQGDAVPLLVELTGRRVNAAYLEMFTKSGGRSVVQLQPAPGGRFSAGIQVAREDVEYRIRAFDAITRKYKLQAAARPSVTHFHKEYHYPAYTGLPAKTADEEGGDLTGVEGTEVDLAIRTNQPVKLAVISVEAGHKTVEIPLTPRADGQLTAKLPLKTAGVYRVELVSAATGFENKFNPEYELRVAPDTIPQVTLQTPERDLIASANEVIGITATANDDIALVKVEQQVKVNDGKWTSRPISQQRGAEVKIDERWDLFQQGVHPGDSITTKLVATDCKGNRGESRPVSITIAAAGFDRSRLDALAAERQLLKDVLAWQNAAAALEQKHTALRKLVESTPAADLAQRRAALGEFVPAVENCASLAAAAQTQLVVAIRAAAPGHETANLVLLSRIIAHGQALLQYLPRQLQGQSVEPLPEFSRDLSRLAADTCAWISRRGKQAGDNYAKLVTTEEIDIINENLQVIAREQSRLATMAQNSGDDAKKWQPVAGRLKVVLAEVATTEEALKAAAAASPDALRDRLVRLQKRLGDTRADATAALAAPILGKALLAPTLNLARAATEITQQMLDLKREQNAQMLGAVQQLHEQVELSWMGFEKLKQEVEDMIRPEKMSVETRADLASGRWDARSGIWKAYGDAEELRPDADAAFVKDVRSLRLALDGIREELVTPGPIPGREAGWKRVGVLDQAYRILEAAHDIAQLANGYDLLATAERYQAGVKARTSNATDYFRLQQRLPGVETDLVRTNLLNPLNRKLTQEARLLLSKVPADQATRSIDEEMRQRQRNDRESNLLPAQAERVAGLVREALAVLRPAVDEARQILNAAQPKLAERLAQLAKEAKELQTNNAEKAEDKTEKPPEQAKAEAKQNLAQQQKLDEKVEAVKDAIRAEANLQNLMEKEGREKARDADDALAMLKDPPPRAEQALNDAAKAERPAEQKDAMKAAAQEDQKLADALDKIAKHLDAVEKGDAEKTRLALREEEKNLGVKADLDQQYAKAEELAKTAEQSPEGMLAKLEKALEKNPLMRQELSSVSKDLLQKANTQLAAATKQESAIAREIEKLAAQPKPAAPPQTPPANANPQANTDKPPANANPQANADKPPANANPQANAEKPPANANPQANANKPPANANPQANADKPPANANPQANADKPPANVNPQANADKPPANVNQQASADKPPANANPQANADKPPANANKPPGEAVTPSAPPAAPKPPAPNPALAKAAEQQKPIAKNANEAGDAVERAGRHEERLKNEQPGEQLQKLGADVKATAQTEVPKAEQALTKAEAAADAKDAVGAAEQDLKKQLARLGDAQAGQPPEGAAPPDGAAKPEGAPKPADMAKQDGVAKPAAAAKPNAGAKPDGAAKPADLAKQNAGAKPDAGANPPGAGQPEGAKPDGAAKPEGVAKQDPGTPSPAGDAKPLGATPGTAGKPEGVAKQDPGTPPPGGAKPAGTAPAGQNPPATAEAATPPPGSEDPLAALAANTPATPQQQVWMARALDALDAALHANPAGAQPGEPAKGDQANQPPQGQPKPGEGQKPGEQPGQQPGQQAGKPGSEAAQAAQKAMAAAAQAAAAEMRANRSPTPPGEPGAETAKGQMAASKTGARADANGSAYGKLAAGTVAATGNWGKLPKQMAEQLSQGQREAVSAEYQKEVETYYRVIAERARKNAK